ncbi:ABC transporter substrate-binding protein [Paenibacillus agaridevorans]|uniref:ABC transporter substrate-binding protein n=1 Tax=Paenibacillus agaridevorans TaxID=171404 RepID=A0A2R5EQT9_9BACL|nr:sugar ABC transporter substrate-binding protein [Paenibacillus agaridevorans]GBG07388.1 ABC transporter substrate-binding protein [Paenibacillus agaridevorans]
MYKKGLTVMMAIGLAFTLTLAGCSGGQNGSSTTEPSKAPEKQSEATSKPQENVTLTFWDENPGPNRTPFYEELIKRFEDQNPHIKVEYVGIPASSNKQKYDVAIAANDTPDVAGINMVWLSDFVAKGAVAELDPYFDAWSEKDKISANMIDFDRGLSADGKLYYLPHTMFLDILWYRTDWVKDAGLNAPDTWDDFFKNIEQLTDIPNNRYGFSIRGGGGSINQLTSMIYAYSGIGEYFTADGKATVNDPKVVEFLNKYVALYKKNTPVSDVTNGNKEMNANFDTSTTAMIQHNFGSYNDHVTNLGTDKFAGLIPPKSDNGKRVVVPVANGLVLFKDSKHPEEAWKFLSFLMSAESQTYWNENIAQMPTNTVSLQSDYVKNTQHIQQGAQVLEDPDTISLKLPFYLPDYTKITTQQLEPDFQKVLTDKMTVESFVKGWADSMEQAQAEYIAAMKK